MIESLPNWKLLRQLFRKTKFMTFHQRHDSDHRQAGRWVRWWLECRALGRMLRDLVADWANRDRIRIAPTTGRLLGLCEQERILLFDDVYIVQQRVVSGDANGVVFRLVADDSFAVLTVRRELNGCGWEGELKVGPFVRPVYDDDVAVLSKGPS